MRVAYPTGTARERAGTRGDAMSGWDPTGACRPALAVDTPPRGEWHMIVLLIPVGILAVIVAYAALTAYGHRLDPQSVLHPIRQRLGAVGHRLRRTGIRLTRLARAARARAATRAPAGPVAPPRTTPALPTAPPPTAQPAALPARRATG